eukprot:tig00000057_g89.t1
MGLDGFRGFVRQCEILLYKNWSLTRRNKKSTIIQLIAPFIFVLAIFLLQFALKQNAVLGPATSVVTKGKETVMPSTLTRCIPNARATSCITVAWAPSDDWAAKLLVDQIRIRNNIPESEVKAFDSAAQIDTFLLANPNSTAGAVVFDIVHANEKDPRSAPLQISYSLQYNQTQIYRRGRPIRVVEAYAIPLQLAVEREILSFQARCMDAKLDQAACEATGMLDTTLEVTKVEYPHRELLSLSAVALYGPVFIFGALMFNFVIQISQIVMEQELKLREGMRQMGLKDSAYWLTWGITNLAWNTLTGLIIIVSGAIFQFGFFLKNDFPTYFFLFFLFGLAMVSLAFFVSTVISKASTAASLGFVIFVVGIILQSLAQQIYNDAVSLAIGRAFALLPMCLLGKGLKDLGDVSSKQSDVGLRWAERMDAKVTASDNNWSMNNTYQWLILDFFLYLVLALYLDNVIPSHYGQTKGPFYFLYPSYWTGKEDHTEHIDQTDFMSPEDRADMDEDIRNEEQMLRSNQAPPHTAVKIMNLRKTYMKRTLGLIADPTTEFVAVKGTWLTMEEGKLFCLLGHNGAGKTTTFNMLTGLFKPTVGDATIFGHSIIKDMDKIRKIMGVCPQHDILWNDLSGRDHLRIYAGFKGVPRNRIEEEVEERLKDVELTSSGNVPAGAYSGGMRRRLSVAIALIGNPGIVFLDEPTTGMDPVSRRQVWNLIEKVKRDRVIVLTTHSMEEADILGDRIGIMKAGRVSVLGTSLRLKNKFGTGYRMTLLYEHRTEAEGRKIGDEVRSFVERELRGAEVAAVLPGCWQFRVPREKIPELPDFFERFEAVKEQMHITDIQLSLTTLEEVFMKVTEEEEHVKDETEERKIRKEAANAQLLFITGFLCGILCCINFCKYRNSRSEKAKKLAKWSCCLSVLWFILVIIIIAAAGRAARRGGDAPLEPAPSRGAEPTVSYEPTQPLLKDVFAWGLQVGDVTDTTAQFVARARGPGSLSLRYVAASGTTWGSPADPISGSTDLTYNDGTPTGPDALFTVTLTGLKADTLYNAWVSTSTGRSAIVRFRTMGNADSTKRIVTLGAVGAIYNSRFPDTVLERAAEEKFDFLLLAGDTIYADPAVNTTANPSYFRSEWSAQLRRENVQALFHSASVAATWSDKEYGSYYDPNALAAKTSMNIQQLALAGAPVITDAERQSRARDAMKEAVPMASSKALRKLSWGTTLDLFVVDLRSERTPRQLVSADTLSQLKAEIKASTATFKVVLQGGPTVDVSSVGVDVRNALGWFWPGYAVDQGSDLVRFLATDAKKCVLFVSGGVQLSGIANVTSTMSRVANYDFFLPEVLVGPAAAPPNRAAVSSSFRVPFTWGTLQEARTYTKLAFDPKLKTVTVQIKDDGKNVLWEQVLQYTSQCSS